MIKKELEIRSEEIQEVIGHTPSWMTRWGMTSIAILLFLLLILTWIIRYPDIIVGEVTISTENPPVKIVNQANGKLIRLYFSEGDFVKNGDVVAEIESLTSKDGISYLQSILKQVKGLLEGDVSKINFNDTLNSLGDLQISYNDLKKLCLDFENLKSSNYSLEYFNRLRTKINEYENLKRITKNSFAISEKELKNAHEKYSIDLHLYKEGVISKTDFFREESVFNQKQQTHENLRAALTQNEITRIDLVNQLYELEFNQAEKERVLKNSILLKVAEIKNQISNWSLKFELMSPSDGRLSIVRPISINHYFRSDDVNFTVIPKNEEYIGIMTIPSQGFGKVNIGQKVRIKINNYPFQEYGQLIGKISSLSQLPNENTYLAKVEMSNRLVTTYNKEIFIRPEMIGTAEIITTDLRLIERIFIRFNKIFDN